MRDKLIKILQAESQPWGYILCKSNIKGLADYLLENGVIVQPCKAGDAVYFPQETDGECEPYVDVGTVFAIGIDERR